MDTPIAKGDGQPKPALAQRLREGTRALHGLAERSGVISEMLHGRADRDSYALLLRNLLPAYRALEDGLLRHRQTAGVGRLFRPTVFRANALESDLTALCGTDYEVSIPLLTPGLAYARRIDEAAQGQGVGLIAHAYVRYLGDLNGGQVVRDLLSRTLGLGPRELAFYAFPQIADLPAFKAEYRQTLSLAGAETDAEPQIIEEALTAFRHNIALSEAVQKYHVQRGKQPAPRSEGVAGDALAGAHHPTT